MQPSPNLPPRFNNGRLIAAADGTLWQRLWVRLGGRLDAKRLAIGTGAPSIILPRSPALSHTKRTAHRLMSKGHDASNHRRRQYVHIDEHLSLRQTEHAVVSASTQ